MSTYKKIYEIDFNRVDFNQEITDFYTKLDEDGKTHLWIITNYKKTDARPDLTKTVVFFHSGIGESMVNPLVYKKGFEPRLVNWDEVIFNPKTSSVEFGKTGSLVKKHVISFPVRYRGDTKIIKRIRIDGDSWLYDLNRDRVNLVILK